MQLCVVKAAERDEVAELRLAPPSAQIYSFSSRGRCRNQSRGLEALKMLDYGGAPHGQALRKLAGSHRRTRHALEDDDPDRMTK
jgi:hypothetical protein